MRAVGRSEKGGKKRYLAKFGIVLQNLGLDGLLTVACHLPNDYCKLQSATLKRLLDAVDTDVLQRCETASVLSNLLSIAATKHDPALRMPLEGVEKEVEAASIMFNCGAVFNSSRTSVETRTPLEELQPSLKHHTREDAEVLSGVSKWKTREETAPGCISAFARGTVHVQTMQPHLSSPWAPDHPFSSFTEHDFDAPRPDLVAEPSLAPPPQDDTPPLPSVQQVQKWNKKRMSAFLQQRGQQFSGTRPELLGRVCGVIEVAQKYGEQWLQGSTLSEKAMETFVKKNQDAWKWVKGDGWTEVALIFSEGLVDTHLGDAGKSARVESIARTRYAGPIHVILGERVNVVFPDGGKLSVHKFRMYAEIARSRTPVERTVYLEGVCTKSLYVLSIEEAICLVPQRVLASTAEAKKYKPCR